MRLFLILMAIVTLSLALGSTLVTLIAVGGATNTVETSVDTSANQGRPSMQGLVTIDIVSSDDSLAQQETAQITDAK